MILSLCFAGLVFLSLVLGFWLDSFGFCPPVFGNVKRHFLFTKVFYTIVLFLMGSLYIAGIVYNSALWSFIFVIILGTYLGFMVSGAFFNIDDFVAEKLRPKFLYQGSKCKMKIVSVETGLQKQDKSTGFIMIDGKKSHYKAVIYEVCEVGDVIDVVVFSATAYMETVMWRR